MPYQLGRRPPLDEPLHWRAKRDPKAVMLSLQPFLREGRVDGLCWAQSKPEGPKGCIPKRGAIHTVEWSVFSLPLPPLGVL